MLLATDYRSRCNSWPETESRCYCCWPRRQGCCQCWSRSGWRSRSRPFSTAPAATGGGSLLTILRPRMWSSVPIVLPDRVTCRSWICAAGSDRLIGSGWWTTTIRSSGMDWNRKCNKRLQIYSILRWLVQVWPDWTIFEISWQQICLQK